ncbi:23S rRNA (uracil(1939)-C(5))-methyltransferase RlmD [Tetragenococcus solitarius]|uniref:23S rRNA (Uracil(1939)-C(5))-methyltransferase RlmD n=1 Tax=Tetragenococcus solitarius TaxID=71453 RepID=A0ABN3YAD1_9ENTE|nr:23S rRNA (uracil(1939)-C(5))-methyltransferase RlmD [Tetragenococcus solitarius]
MNTQVAVGQTLQLQIKRLGINGEGIGYFKRLIIFVPKALPGEKITAKITQTNPKFAQASLIKVLCKSSDRVTPPCPFYDRCGGCQLQHLTYNKQLDFKQDLLLQALKKYRPKGYQRYQVKPTLGMSEPWYYRNKAQFQLRYNPKTKKAEAGLYEANSHRLVAIDDCPVQEKTTQKVINTVVQLINKYELPIYDERKNSGILKTLMVRIGVKTNEVQLVFITHTKKLLKKNTLINEINQRLPEVVSIMQNVQDKKSSQIFGEETIHLWGKETIEEQLNDLTFDLSTRAFFQLNPQQTSILYDEAIKALNITPDETVVDAYCGVGTIGLSVADKAKEVRGMDIIDQAIEDAKRNAQKMGYTNTYYETGTAEKLLPKWLKEGFTPDSIIVDPPRTGLDDKLLQTLVATPPKKLVYISCNVSTLAKDLRKLAKVFKVEYLQSVDMFPQTARCEVVTKLTRKF